MLITMMSQANYIEAVAVVVKIVVVVVVYVVVVALLVVNDRIIFSCGQKMLI